MAMKRFLIFTFALILLLLINGCGTTSQTVRFPDQTKLVEEQGKGRIYVIGKPFFMNIASHSFPISVNADYKLVGYILGHSYLCWEREPGIATIFSDMRIDLNIESGKVYYVLAHIGPAWETVNFLVPGSGEIVVRLEVVNEEKGRKALLEAKPPELKPSHP
jgi:hypothetical protein